MQDKTQELLRAMTQVSIENAIRQRVALHARQDIAANRNARGAGLMSVVNFGLYSTPSGQALGAAWIAINSRMRPNTNMLAAIGYAVDEMMATPPDALEPHTVH